MKLNEKFHPKFVPHSVTVEAIKTLRKNVDSPLCMEFGITKELLDYLEFNIKSLSNLKDF
jgi:hypothetical protein